MTGIEDTFNTYCSSFEKIAKDIREGIDEGLSEGLKEGIKQGFVEGIKECRTTGFDNIEVESTEEVLNHIFETISDESAFTIIQQTVSNEYWTKISPSFNQKMEKACNKTVEEIKSVDYEVDEANYSYIESRVSASEEKITECIGNACGGVRKSLPTYEIFAIFFECLQEEFNRDLSKNLKVLEEKIRKEIENKINNKR